MGKIREYLFPWMAEATFNQLSYLLIGVIFILLVLIFSKKAINRKIEDQSKRYRAKKISNLFAYFLIVLVALFIYSDKLGDVGVAVGLAGAGIAFALQEVIVSFAGWLNITFTNQVKVGQRIKIGNIKGDIIDIGVLKSTIMEVGDWVDGDLYNGRITSISNSFVFKEPIQNYSADYPFLWDEITIPLRVESDFKAAREKFTEIIVEVCGDYAQSSKKVWGQMQEKFLIEDSKVDPMVTLKFDENWITFTLRYVVDYTKRRTTKDVLFTRILEEINKSNGQLLIATAAMDINLSNEEG